MRSVMWTSTNLELDSRTTATTLRDGSRDLSFREVIGLWREYPEFRAWFTLRLRESPFDAYYWELPPVTNQTLDRTFEYVLIDAPGFIGLSADAEPFRAQFAARGSAEVLTFPNLRGDAVLVVPAPVSSEDCYMHLAHFVRRAPVAQVDVFWKAVGMRCRSVCRTAPSGSAPPGWECRGCTHASTRGPNTTAMGATRCHRKHVLDRVL